MYDLEDYFTYLEDNPNSFIARVYGLFQVQMKGIIPINFLLMANTIKINNADDIFKIYDLKGSTY